MTKKALLEAGIIVSAVSVCVAMLTLGEPTIEAELGLDAQLEELSGQSQEQIATSEPSGLTDDKAGSTNSEVPHERLSPNEAARKTVAALDAAFATEKADPNWAPDQEKRLKEILTRGAVKGLTQLDVACRRTMCRLSVTTGASLDADVLQKLLFQPELNVSCYTGPDPDGIAHARLFVSRKGSPLTAHPEFLKAARRG